MRKVLLELSDGKSDKFWEGTAEGLEMRAQFGRRGTNGQDKSWQFGSEAEAMAQLSKVVKEKVGKGYKTVSDVSSGSVSTPAKTVAATPAIKSNISPKPAAPVAEPGQHQSPTTTAKTQVEQTAQNICYAFSKRTQPLPKPMPRPFDKESAAGPKDDKLSWKNITSHYNPADNWIADFKRGQYWSREEALFWFIDFVARGKDQSGYMVQITHGSIVPPNHARTVAELEAVTLADFSDSSVRQLMADLADAYHKKALIRGLATYVESNFELAIPLLFLFPFHQFLVLWEEFWSASPGRTQPLRAGIEQIIDAIQTVIVPYITDEELAKVREYLEPEIRSLQFCIDWPRDPIPFPYLIAGMFGFNDFVEPIVTSIPDGLYNGTSDINGFGGLIRPDILLFGLKDSESIYNHFCRTGLGLWSEEQCLTWLALFGATRIEQVVAFARDYGRKRLASNKYYWKYANDYLRPLFKIRTAEAAREIFFLSMEQAYRTQCQNWMRKNPALALEALVKIAGSSDKLAPVAKDLVRDMIHDLKDDSVPQPLLQACRDLNTSASAIRQSLPQVEKPAWLAGVFASHKIKKLTLPIWAVSAALEPVIIEGYCLSDEEVDLILYALKSSTEDKIKPLLKELREATERSDFDKFVWDLFQRWIAEYAPPKDKWCMLAVGILGSDATIANLVPLMKEWRAGGNPARAGYGLECIKAADTDAALMIIHKISMSASLKSMRNRAQILIKEIAQSRGLSPMQLEDMIVPTCGLDERGERIFDYGSRQFRFILSNDLKAHVKEESGKAREDLPAPNKDDDADKAAAALASWKDLKKLIRSTAQIQARRLELAMIGGRRWSAQNFDLYFVRHPLMWHLCKPLIWGVYDSNGKLTETFRITDERDFSNSAEKSFVVGQDIQIGLAHPLDMKETVIGAWGQILADYELIPPFPQLSRGSLNPTATDIEKNEFGILQNIEIEAIFVPSILEKRDWERTSAEDGGLYFGHYKYFPGKDVTVLVTYNGIYSGDPKSSDPQCIETVAFASGDQGKNTSWGYGWSGLDKMPFDTVDPIVMSEVYTDLSILAAKGKKV